MELDSIEKETSTRSLDPTGSNEFERDLGIRVRRALAYRESEEGESPISLEEHKRLAQDLASLLSAGATPQETVEGRSGWLLREKNLSYFLTPDGELFLCGQKQDRKEFSRKARNSTVALLGATILGMLMTFTSLLSPHVWEAGSLWFMITAVLMIIAGLSSILYLEELGWEPTLLDKEPYDLNSASLLTGRVEQELNALEKEMTKPAEVREKSRVLENRVDKLTLDRLAGA